MTEKTEFFTPYNGQQSQPIQQKQDYYQQEYYQTDYRTDASNNARPQYQQPQYQQHQPPTPSRNYPPVSPSHTNEGQSDYFSSGPPPPTYQAPSQQPQSQPFQPGFTNPNPVRPFPPKLSPSSDYVTKAAPTLTSAFNPQSPHTPTTPSSTYGPKTPTSPYPPTGPPMPLTKTTSREPLINSNISNGGNGGGGNGSGRPKRRTFELNRLTFQAGNIYRMSAGSMKRARKSTFFKWSNVIIGLVIAILGFGLYSHSSSLLDTATAYGCPQPCLDCYRNFPYPTLSQNCPADGMTSCASVCGPTGPSSVGWRLGGFVMIALGALVSLWKIFSACTEAMCPCCCGKDMFLCYECCR